MNGTTRSTASTGKGKRTIPRNRKTPPTEDRLLSLVEKSLDDDKAQDIVVIPLAGKTQIADYMVIASGTSQRHVAAMAEHLRDNMKTFGVGEIFLEGAGTSDWVLVDGGDVIVHLFRPEARSFYGLEKMWDVDGAGETKKPARVGA